MSELNYQDLNRAFCRRQGRAEYSGNKFCPTPEEVAGSRVYQRWKTAVRLAKWSGNKKPRLRVPCFREVVL
jgi:hypothetical protein